MGDRFDSMRGKGINTNDATATAADIVQGKTAYVAGGKVTGSLVPSGGSSDLNVFVQSTEPTKKDGIWIKESGNYDTTKCIYYNAPDGNTIDPTIVSFLDGESCCVGQVIVNGILYWFSGNSVSGGTGSCPSYKYDLKTKVKTVLNIPRIAFVNSASIGSVGAVYYNGKIYIFLAGTNIYYYIYDIATDTLSNTYYSAGNFISGSSILISSLMLYQGKVYVLGRKNNISSGAITLLEYDIDNNSSSTYTISGLSNIAIGGVNGTINKYMYIAAADKKIYRLDVTTQTVTQIKDCTSVTDYFSSDDIVSYAFGNNLYIFNAKATINSSSTSMVNYYFKYNINSESIEKVNLDYSYSIKKTNVISTSSNIYGNKNPFVLDETTGYLYIINRFSVTGVYNIDFPITDSTPTACIQLFNIGSDLSFNDGTAVLYLGTSNRFVKLIDESSIYTGVQNTYLMTNGNLDDTHTAFYGDGDRWNVFKNPYNETCTVTFDTNGGTGTYASQTITRGGTITEPQTNPTKSGYTFAYWTLYGKEFDFTSKISTDCSLVARWLDTFTVTFDDGNGNVTTEEVLEESRVTKPADPTSSTKVFKYWTLNGEKFNFNTPITGNITLVGSWDTFDEIDYIQNSGTQFIDTGFKPNQNTSVELTILIPTSGVITRFFETRNSEGGASSDVFGILTFDDSNKLLQFRYNAGTNASNQQLSANTQYTLKTEKNKLYVNNSLKITATQATFQVSYNLGIFGFTRPSGMVADTSIYRLYSFKLYDNGTLIRDFQPIQLTSTGEYCLFDKVNNIAYYNGGTGTFTGGSVIS